jgi:hypothetical protein
MRVRPLLIAALVATLLAGCGKEDVPVDNQPRSGIGGGSKKAAEGLGFPTFATKNTTRVGGADPTASAAGVARAVFPATTADTRPDAVTLVDDRDWRIGVAAAALMSRPIRAPILLTDCKDLPAASKAALDALGPRGARSLDGAQVIRIGDVADPDGLKSRDLEGGDPFTVAGEIDRVLSAVRGGPSGHVIVASADEPGFGMPAAGWAAKSGDPVLYVKRDVIPPATRTALRRHDKPKIYVLGPEKAVGAKVLKQLRSLGRVTRIEGADPVRNAIAFARYLDGPFGWGVVDPGHGLVFTTTKEPMSAAAAAPLSASGTYGPLLLLDDAKTVPRPLSGYLLDIQPGYRRDPVRGVYNHGWVIGDERAVSASAQARLDALLEITQVDRTATQ